MVKFLDIQKITQSFEPELSEAINRVVKKGWFLLGEETSAFEAEYGSFTGTRHCIGVANGLDALRIILRAYMEMGIMAEGDEIIVPANTYIASILAITENRLKPILVEPDILNYNIDFSLIERLITPRTKAIMIVHLYGRSAWSERLEEIASKFRLRIIEDNAQAAGAYKWLDGNPGPLQRTGSLGDAAGHSFYPGKNLGALGDGGAITTNNSDLAAIVRSIANYGSSKKYVCDFRGLNSRLDEIQSAVLRVKLCRLDSDNQRRRDLSQFYHSNISNENIKLPESTTGRNGSISEFLGHVWHLFVIRTTYREKLQNYLAENGIQTLIHYPLAPHKQNAYREMNNLDLPVTEKIHNEVLSLPISQVMTEDDAGKVVEVMNKFKPQ
jgi:dTDP-4-amino-4,6-dideoxygalactose transaminase